MKKFYLVLLALLSFVTFVAYEKIAIAQPETTFVQSLFQLSYTLFCVCIFFTVVYVKNVIGNLALTVSKNKSSRKNFSKIITALFVLFFIAGFSEKGFATTYYSIANGNWNSNNTWSTTTGGGAVGAGVFPVAGDVVIIERNFTVTINGTYFCTTLQVGSPNNKNTGALQFSAAGTSLTVSGTVTVGGYGNTNRTGTITFISGSTLTAGAVVLGGSGTAPIAAGTIDMTNGGTLITGNLSVNTVSGNTWIPGTGTVQMNATNTLPATIFTTFNNLTINIQHYFFFTRMSRTRHPPKLVFIIC